MTQAAIELSTTPPYPGLQMVLDINKALEALGTDFAGVSDPAAFAKPFMTWADTGNMLLKRRNAAGTAWVVEGALFKSGKLINIQVFNTPGTFTYTPTAGTQKTIVKVQGGGGAGGGVANTGASTIAAGLGGSAGAYGESLLNSGFAGQTIAVGAGGAAVSGNTGGSGGASSFGSLLSSPGGPGGSGGVGVIVTPPGGYFQQGNAPTSTGGNLFNSGGSAGGGSFALSTNSWFSGAGASSRLGAGGGSLSYGNQPGKSAVGFGAGGSGATITANNSGSVIGGQGGPGIVIIEEYA